MCIVSGHDLPVDEEATIVFTPEPSGHPMELLGAVRFRSDTGAGVEFLNISRADRLRLLAAIVARINQPG